MTSNDNPESGQEDSWYRDDLAMNPPPPPATGEEPAASRAPEPLPPLDDEALSESTDSLSRESVVVEAPRPKRSWAKRLAVAGFVAWTVAAVAGGIAIGTRQRTDPPPPPADIAVNVETVEVPDVDPSTAATDRVPLVPNVLGLDPTEAQAAVLDAAEGTAIEIVESPRAGDPGFVVDQRPLPGSEIGDDPVVLTVSAAVDIPPVVGTTVDESRDELEALGAQVRLASEYQAGVVADEVLAIEPAEGPLPLEVTLTVAAPAAQLDLGIVDTVESACGSDRDVGVDGVLVPSAITCTISRASDRSVAWDLSRDVDSVSFTAGVVDTSDPAAGARVEVLVDGQAVASQAAGFGAPVRFDVPTAGALRFEVRVVVEAPDDVAREWSRSAVALVDMVATGEAAALDELAGDGS